MAPLLAAAAAALAWTVTSAAVTLPSIFSDGCVLQMAASYDQRPFVYGTADPGELVQVNLTTTGAPASYPVFAGPDGRWQAQIDSSNFAGNGTLTVAGSSGGLCG